MVAPCTEPGCPYCAQVTDRDTRPATHYDDQQPATSEYRFTD